MEPRSLRIERKSHESLVGAKAPLSISEGNSVRRSDSISSGEGSWSGAFGACWRFARTFWPKAQRSLIMRLLFCSILCFTLITAGEATRATRGLSFRKGSSFFYRVNYKITTFSYTPIFAQASGFKLVWQLPSGSAILRKGRSISDVHQAAEIVYESHGFDGRSCLLKNICQAMEYVSQREGVIAKILKLLVGTYTANSSSTDPLYCDVHARNCPLQLIGIDGFME